jgi:transcriptional regulator with XRE-family HTH domain
MKVTGKEQPLDVDDQLLKIGNRIEYLRVKKGDSRYETFAYQHEISRAQYGRYQQGKDLRISSLIKALNSLGAGLKEFFDDSF